MSNPRLHLFRGALPGLGSPTACCVESLASQLLMRAASTACTLMESAQELEHDMVFTSIGMAAERFTVSFHAHDWSEQIVDLVDRIGSRSFGADKQDVLLRLRTRATALLATDNDPASAIFKDLGQLYSYGLRWFMAAQ